MVAQSGENLEKRRNGVINGYVLPLFPKQMELGQEFSLNANIGAEPIDDACG